MNSVFLLRLTFDLIAACLLLFAFSYWWLGNVAHEVAGTAMFLLLIAHNVFNRRWYGRLSTGRRDARSLLNTAITFALATAVLALLVTSILISNALSGVMSPYAGFTVRQIHVLAAYWVLLIVAVHLGLRWPMLMGVARSLFGISGTSTVRILVLRIIAVAVAAIGVWSSFQLGVGGKLSMQMTLDWWNFEASVVGFFGHCIAIVGLYITLTYYTMKWLQRHKRATTAGNALHPSN